MTQSNAQHPDFLSRDPYSFRSVMFWEDAEAEDFEVYTNPLSGWWYRIRRAAESDQHVPASGYILECWQYGNPIHSYILTDHNWIENASLAEIISVTAVLATEQTSPKIFFEGSLQEQDRIQSRALMWLKSAPKWLRNLDLPSNM